MGLVHLLVSDGQAGIDWIRDSVFGAAFLAAFTVSQAINGKNLKDLKESLTTAEKSHSDESETDRDDFRRSLDRVTQSFERALAARDNDYRELHRMHAELIDKVSNLVTAVHETRQMVISGIRMPKHQQDGT